MTDYLCRSDEFPVVGGYLNCKWFQGSVQAVVAPIKFCSVLLGNIPGAKYPTDIGSTESLDSNCSDIEIDKHNNGKEKSPSVNAVTRSQAKVRPKPAHPLLSSSIDLSDVSSNDFQSLQKSCKALEEVHEFVASGKEIHKFNTTYVFKEIEGFIYKMITKSRNNKEQGKKLLVVPKECRLHILKLSHDLPVARHYSYHKTEQKIKEIYFWPGMSRDIKDYCR